jgi:hypothetical protein
MAVSQSQRLRKAAAKAAKRKAVVAEKLARDRRELSISKPRHIDFAASPIVACMVTENFESVGMSTLTVVRKLSLGRYGIAAFVLDLWCLGVKDAFFRVAEPDDYEVYQAGLAAAGGTAPIDPSRARRLLHDTAAYGVSNGFPPPADYVEVERIFGDVAAAEASFTFGLNGKPHYVPGPDETHLRTKRILAVLEQRFGLDGFTFASPFELFDGDDADDDEFDEADAEEMAAIAPPAEPEPADGAPEGTRAGEETHASES